MDTHSGHVCISCIGILKFKEAAGMDKKFRKILSIMELFFSLSLMYAAGMNPAESARNVLVSVLFGVCSLLSLGIAD